MTIKDAAIAKMFRGRELITPDDLAPFGALITTNSGFKVELVAWLGPSIEHDVYGWEQRVGIGIVVTPECAEKLVPLCFLESDVVDWIPQRFPAFSLALAQINLNTINSSADPGVFLVLPPDSKPN